MVTLPPPLKLLASTIVLHPCGIPLPRIPSPKDPTSEIYPIYQRQTPTPDPIANPITINPSSHIVPHLPALNRPPTP
ncbi:hypothetical protein DL95DRAFT_390139 [Leptodontidium sp. 2 PMI_412]|nr:hypothetical protein DL95DRAFT_390139 [Leptodontidium sp. 2 PMI_412]